MNITDTTTVVASGEHVASEVSDEVVILSFKNDTYYGLNPVGARIWSLIQEPRRVDALCDQLTEEYDVERAQCEREVFELLEDLASEDLISVETT